MNRIVSLMLLLCLPAPLAAHPHVFVRTEIEILTDESQKMTGVRLTWIYDDYFSLLMTADLGIDLDGDMVLTDEEQAALEASISTWPDGFEGDLYVTRDDVPVPLGPRQDHSARMHDGVIHETHTRLLAEPAGQGDSIHVQVYDPYFYVAYEIAGDVRVSGGAGCLAGLHRADLDTAYAMVEDLLNGRAASDVGPDEDFPRVGNLFADTVYVTCAG